MSHVAQTESRHRQLRARGAPHAISRTIDRVSQQECKTLGSWLDVKSITLPLFRRLVARIRLNACSARAVQAGGVKLGAAASASSRCVSARRHIGSRLKHGKKPKYTQKGSVTPYTSTLRSCAARNMASPIRSESDEPNGVLDDEEEPCGEQQQEARGHDALLELGGQLLAARRLKRD